jgi:hypothetical protein
VLTRRAPWLAWVQVKQCANRAMARTRPGGSSSDPASATPAAFSNRTSRAILASIIAGARAYSMQVTVRRPDMAEKQRFGQWRVG